MNRKLIDTKVTLHQGEVKKLKVIENDLAKHISETGSEKLMEIFLDWQNQRIKCNENYLAILNIITDETN